MLNFKNREFTLRYQLTNILSILLVFNYCFLSAKMGYSQITQIDSLGIVTEEAPRLKNKSDLNSSKVEEREKFIYTLKNENLWDNESVTNLKKYYLIELRGEESSYDINDIEYYSHKLSFLEFLKGAKEFRLDSLLSLTPNEYLKRIYKNAFMIIGIDSVISNFKISYNKENINNSKEYDYFVSYNLNEIEYKDSYSKLEYFMEAYSEELKNNSYSNVQNFDNVLLSKNSINLLLTDLQNPKRIIVTRVGNVLKYNFIKKDIAYDFEEFTYANSISEIESTIKGAMDVGLINKLTDKQLNKISLKYRENHRQIVTPYIFEFAGSDKIIKFQNYEKNYLETDWIIPLKKITNKYLKIENFSDNKIEFLNNISNSKKSKTAAQDTIVYKFEYFINGKQFRNSISVKKRTRYELEIENIFNSINQNINQALELVNSNNKIYCDGFENIYLLNEEQKIFLTNEKFWLELK